MDKAFLLKLRATLDALIANDKATRARLDALEHSVNDTIMGGLSDAANEWKDNIDYSCFVDDYSEIYSPYCELAKVLNKGGDDYDFAEELYSGSKGKEDVKAYIEDVISKLQAQKEAIDAISNNSNGSNDEITEIKLEQDDSGKSVNDYLEEIDKALKGE